MQSFSSRIWTHVAISISYNDNHYTTATFPKVICPKVIITRLEFELAYKEVTVQHFIHYTTGATEGYLKKKYISNYDPVRKYGHVVLNNFGTKETFRLC